MLDDPYVPTDTAALFLGVSRMAMQNWRKRKIGPAYAKLTGLTVVYRLSELVRFAAERTAQAGRTPPTVRGRPPGQKNRTPEEIAAAGGQRRIG